MAGRFVALINISPMTVIIFLSCITIVIVSSIYNDQTLAGNQDNGISDGLNPNGNATIARQVVLKMTFSPNTMDRNLGVSTFLSGIGALVEKLTAEASWSKVIQAITDGTRLFDASTEQLVPININAARTPAQTIPGVGVFFYPWYGHWRHWEGPGHAYNPPYTWSSHYIPDIVRGAFIPSVELYDSSDKKIALWQLYEMRRAHVSYAIVSWWGPGSYEDIVLDRLMRYSSSGISPHPKLKWCILYELEGYGDPSVDQIVSDLKYIVERYGLRNNYLRVDGKPVIFVYAGGNDGVDYVMRWYRAKQVLEGKVFTVLKVFQGYRKYANYADSWYQHAPNIRFELQEPFSGFVSPGYWKIWETRWSKPLLKRNGGDFKEALAELLNSDVGIKTVQTWNEWHEGTQVEPGQEVNVTISPYLPLNSYGDEYIEAMGALIPNIYPYDPTVEVQPTVIISGVKMTRVTGKGFPPQGSVHILLDGSEGIANISADAGGRFAYSVDCSTLSPGLHMMVAVGENESVAVCPIYVAENATMTTATTTPTKTVTSGANVKEGNMRRGVGVESSSTSPPPLIPSTLSNPSPPELESNTVLILLPIFMVLGTAAYAVMRRKVEPSGGMEETVKPEHLKPARAVEGAPWRWEDIEEAVRRGLIDESLGRALLSKADERAMGLIRSMIEVNGRSDLSEEAKMVILERIREELRKIAR